MWVPCGLGLYPGPRVATVGAWPVPGPREAVVRAWPIPWALCGRRGGVARPLGFVSPPGKCGLSLGLLWLLWGRGLSFGLRVATVGAWPVPWAPYGRSGGVAHPLVPV